MYWAVCRECGNKFLAPHDAKAFCRICEEKHFGEKKRLRIVRAATTVRKAIQERRKERGDEDGAA